MNADGSGQQAIFTVEQGAGWHHVGDHDWSPDGTQIAALVDGALHLYSLETETSRLVVETPYANHVDWSPTGEWIALGVASGNPRGLFLVRPDGSELHHIGPDGQAVEPEWSPNGTGLAAAYFHDPESNVELRVVQLTGESHVIATDLNYTGASWSPDGTQIVYVDRDQRLSVVKVENGSTAKITDANASYGSVDWSSDGTRIAYAGPLGVFSIQADGTGKVKLLDAGQSPRWHPTGVSLAVVLGDDIVRVTNDGSGQTNLTNSPDRYDSDPMWSPDATQITYLSSEKPYIPPDETIQLTVTLRAHEHLVLKGRVQQEGQEYSSCMHMGIQVLLQRRKNGSWVTIRRVTPSSDGRFSTEVADRPGRFRALVKKEVGPGVGGNTITCNRALSTVTIHRH